MPQEQMTFGRTELAMLYFPNILPTSAWSKFRLLMLANPDLAPLARIKRRTFMPAEVKIIYQHLGHP